MGIANTSGAMGNVLRLQGLKNVSGRRVMPGEEFVDENEYNDVAGSANPLPKFSNFIPPEEQNLPQPEMGGELNSQSYDVRANSVENPQEEPSFFQNLGRSLAGLVSAEGVYDQEPETVAQTPPIETAQVDMQEGLPPVTESEQVAEQQMEPPSEIPDEMMERGMPEQGQPEEEIKEPGTYVQIGATQQLYDELESNPELKSEIERIFDVSLSPERMAEVADLEQATQAYIDKLNGVETALDKREQELLAKVESRNLSTSEKISMAIALLAPAIIAGAIAGKEGFFGGLANSGKNIGDMLARKEKEVGEAQELLPGLALEKAKIGKEKLETSQQTAEMKRKIQESAPNHALKKLFQRDGMLLNGKLVLNTGNPLLPLKSSAIRTEKDFDTFREKTMPKLTEKLSVTEQGLHLLDNLTELMDVSKKGKEGIARDYIPLYDYATKTFKALVPGARDTFTDENGNKVTIAELFETTKEQLSDMYSQALGGGGSKGAFKTYREHFHSMISNPYTVGFREAASGKGSEDTVRAEINSVKNKFEENIVSLLNSKGVDTGPVKELFSTSGINTKHAESKRKKDRANEAVKHFVGK